MHVAWQWRSQFRSNWFSPPCCAPVMCGQELWATFAPLTSPLSYTYCFSFISLTMRGAILTCAQEPTWVSLIYRTIRYALPVVGMAWYWPAVEAVQKGVCLNWLNRAAPIWHRGVYSNWPTRGQHRTGAESDITSLHFSLIFNRLSKRNHTVVKTANIDVTVLCTRWTGSSSWVRDIRLLHTGSDRADCIERLADDQSCRDLRRLYRVLSQCLIVRLSYSDSVAVFKSRLKTFLFSQVFSSFSAH